MSAENDPKNTLELPAHDGCAPMSGSGFPWSLEPGDYVIMRYASGPHTATVIGKRTLKNERCELRIIDIKCHVDGGYPRGVTESSWHLLYENTPEAFAAAKKDAREAWASFRAEMDIQNSVLNQPPANNSSD